MLYSVPKRKSASSGILLSAEMHPGQQGLTLYGSSQDIPGLSNVDRLECYLNACAVASSISNPTEPTESKHHLRSTRQHECRA